jgi:hypothetical protein
MTQLTIEELEAKFQTIGKEGHKLQIDLSALTAKLDRLTTRAKYGYKNVFYYKFKTEQKLLDYCNEVYNNQIAQTETKSTYKEEQKVKKQQQQKDVKVGDVFCYSWGWEQTNVDFYQVVSKPSPATVIVKSISHETVEDCSWASDYVKPVKDSFCGEEMKVRLNGDSFKRSCGHANLTNYSDKHYRSWYA